MEAPGKLSSEMLSFESVIRENIVIILVNIILRLSAFPVLIQAESKTLSRVAGGGYGVFGNIVAVSCPNKHVSRFSRNTRK